jgi:protein-tyrosine phosphatase
MTDAHTLPIPNAINLRTLAGYKTTDGRMIKPNKLLRSGSLNMLTASDAERLASDYGVGTVIDLRMDEEIQRNPDVLPQGVSYYQLPVLPFSDHATFSQRLKRRFAKPEDPTARMYRKMLTDSHAVTAYRDMFELLLSNTEEGSAVLIHCSAGKDRTGVAAMLIEAALGIPDETIKQDYLLSNVALKSFQSIKKNTDNRNQLEIMRTHPATEDNVLAILKSIDDNYQSWPGYLKRRLGLSYADLQTSRQIYLT